MFLLPHPPICVRAGPGPLRPLRCVASSHACMARPAGRRATDRRHAVIVMHGLRTRRLTVSVAAANVRTGCEAGQCTWTSGRAMEVRARTRWME
jgi:hypothetical protein